MKRNARLADVLYNMHEASGASDEYRKGLIVGTVGTLAAIHLSFEKAVEIVCFHMPVSGTRLIVPESWLVSLGTQMTALGKTYILPV